MKPKQDIHRWRMDQIISRIVEANARRHEKRMSGEVVVNRALCVQWEADELAARHKFEAAIQNAVPPKEVV